MTSVLMSVLATLLTSTGGIGSRESAVLTLAEDKGREGKYSAPSRCVQRARKGQRTQELWRHIQAKATNSLFSRGSALRATLRLPPEQNEPNSPLVSG